MKLLIVRHGKAEERRLAKADGARRLTDEGREQMRRNAKGLRRVAPDIDLLASSPLVRARESAAILAQQFDPARVRELALLVPSADPNEVIGWLAQQAARGTVAIVGHEPHLSAAASLLLGAARPCMVLQKGGACLVELDRAPGAGRLRWLLQPALLQRLA